MKFDEFARWQRFARGSSGEFERFGVHAGRRRAVALLSAAALALAACGGGGETIHGVAVTAAQRGRPCEAAEVEPTDATFAHECHAQQEGEQLKAEASRPPETSSAGQANRAPPAGKTR